MKSIGHRIPSWRTKVGLTAWRNNYILVKQCNVITNPCLNFNGGLVKPALESGHWWVITSHRKQCMYLLIHVLFFHGSLGDLHAIFTRGQFWPSGIVVACICVCVCLSVCQSLACPRNNSGPVQARISKFGPKMQKTLVKVPIVLWTDRPWPSRSNLTWNSKFTPFWACSHHNSPPIQARITKFRPQVQNTLVKIPIVLGGNWSWPVFKTLNFQV